MELVSTNLDINEFCSAEILAALYNKITSRLPFEILSFDPQYEAQSLGHLKNTKEHIWALFQTLCQTPKTQVKEVFEQNLNALIQTIDVATRSPNNLYELTPMWHELTDIHNNFDSLLAQTNEEINQNSAKLSTPIVNNGEVESNVETLMPAQLRKNEQLQSELEDVFVESESLSSEKIWKNRAHKQLRLMVEELSLRSIQIPPSLSWKTIYRWAKSTYDTISVCQASIGLETSHAGLGHCLNLCFNPESLRQSHGNGKMFADTDCNTLVLRRFPKKIQATIWQHEYAHVLDNRVGVLLAREQMPDKKIHSCMFLSQIEQERQLDDMYSLAQQSTEENYFASLSSNSEIYKAQMWMGEAISDAVAGSSSENFKEHHKRCAQEFSRTLIECFALQCFGEPTWLTFSQEVKTSLITHPKIVSYVEHIAENIYKNGVRSFFENYWQNEESTQEFKSVLTTVVEVLDSYGKNKNAQILQEDMELKFKNNLSTMSWDFLKIMRKYYYAHTNSKRYFAKSKTAIAASEHSLKFISPYHTRTLELFARSCEDLQRPLVMSTLDYFIDQENKIKETENYLNPMLNRNERKIFINTLHSLVCALGFKINPNIDLDQLPALKETVKGLAHTTFSTATEDEKIAESLLETVMQKTRLKM